MEVRFEAVGVGCGSQTSGSNGRGDGRASYGMEYEWEGQSVKVVTIPPRANLSIHLSVLVMCAGMKN